jgi:hypothetical protein
LSRVAGGGKIAAEKIAGGGIFAGGGFVQTTSIYVGFWLDCINNK